MPGAGARRLLYCSTVSPQSTAAGELLVHRHLSRLVNWDVMIVTPDHKPVSAGFNPALEVALPSLPKWMQRSRRGMLFGCADSLASRWLFRRFAELADRFQPDVVLSVMVPDSFLSSAALYSNLHGLRFVLLCHDDYSDFVPASGRALLGRVYRQASARLCVSQAMEQEFFRRYGVHGEVLPPIPSGLAGAVTNTGEGEQLVVGFAGSIGAGYAEAIINLADVLGREEGRLVIASPTNRNQFEKVFAHPAVIDLGLLAPDEVRKRFFESGVNVLSVIQSFAREDMRAFRVNFPSKLSEYSTYGLPVLVVAPESASASTWASDNPGAALVVHTVDRYEMEIAVRRLRNAQERRAFAQAMRAAANAFDPDLMQGQFEKALIGPAGAARGG